MILFSVFQIFDKIANAYSEEEKVKLLLHANTQYAVLGDDSAWKRLLRPGKVETIAAYSDDTEKSLFIMKLSERLPHI